MSEKVFGEITASIQSAYETADQNRVEELCVEVNLTGTDAQIERMRTLIWRLEAVRLGLPLDETGVVVIER